MKYKLNLIAAILCAFALGVNLMQHNQLSIIVDTFFVLINATFVTHRLSQANELLEKNNDGQV